MTTRTAVTQFANEVRLVGRVSGAPEERELPSGDVLLVFRLVVPRPEESVRARGGGVKAVTPRRATLDTLDCVAWAARMRRTAGAWQAGDVVEVTGAMRRRFYRSGGGAVSRVEVEVTRGRRRVRRAPG